MAGESLAPAAQALDRLQAAGQRLRARPLEEVLSVLDRVCAAWRDPGDSQRREAEQALGAHARVPAAAVAEVLDAAFGAWSRETLQAWITQEIGSPLALDHFVQSGGARRRASGPRLLAVIAARGVPTTAIGDILAALCVKSPLWLKPPSGADDLAARFAASLAECDPDLGAAIEVRDWRPGSETGRAVLAAADCWVATGGAPTVAALRQAVPPTARLILHGPRMSAAIVTHEALAEDYDAVIRALARDTAFAGQMGCLSPSIAYIEGDANRVVRLAGPLQAACARRWPCPPRQAESSAERAVFAERAARAQVEIAAGHAGVWVGGPDAAWSVQVRMRPEPPRPAPIPRHLALAPVGDAGTVAALCAERRGLVASVGIAGSPARVAALAPALAEAGVERITPLGAMQTPPAAWRRDGRPTLGDLVRWTDWEA